MLGIALSPSAADSATLLKTGPQLIPAITAFRSAAGTALAGTLPDVAALSAGLIPLTGLEEHVRDLLDYQSNIEVFAKPALSDSVRIEPSDFVLAIKAGLYDKG